MLKSVSEVLKEANQMPTRQARINHLRQNQSLPMLRIFAYAFDPRIIWLLPEGDPPYVPLGSRDRNELIGSEGMLHKEARTLYLFVYGDEYNPLGVYEAPDVDVSSLTDADKTRRRQMTSRRELKFVELLESLHPADALLLVAAKNRTINYEGIDRALVSEAFPGLLQETVAMTAERVVARVSDAVKTVVTAPPDAPPPMAKPKPSKRDVEARRSARRSAIVDFLSRRDGVSSADEIHAHLLSLGLAEERSKGGMDFVMKALSEKNAAVERDEAGGWRLNQAARALDALGYEQA